MVDLARRFRRRDFHLLAEIGRGLRLPYGKRTGVSAVDRLTIVSHDKFQEIVDYANSPDSVIRSGLKVVFGSDERSEVVIAEPEIMQRIQPPAVAEGKGEYKVEQPKLLFENPKEQEAAKATLEVIRREFKHLPRSIDLTKPEIQKQIVEKVKEIITPAQQEREGIAEAVNVAEVVAKTITLWDGVLMPPRTRSSTAESCGRICSLRMT